MSKTKRPRFRDQYLGKQSTKDFTVAGWKLRVKGMRVADVLAMQQQPEVAALFATVNRAPDDIAAQTSIIKYIVAATVHEIGDGDPLAFEGWKDPALEGMDATTFNQLGAIAVEMSPGFGLGPMAPDAAEEAAQKGAPKP